MMRQAKLSVGELDEPTWLAVRHGLPSLAANRAAGKVSLAADLDKPLEDFKEHME